MVGTELKRLRRENEMLTKAIGRALILSDEKLSKPLSKDARNHWLSYRIAVDNIREWSGLQAFV